MPILQPKAHAPIHLTRSAAAMFDKLSPIPAAKPQAPKETLASPVEPTKVTARLESVVEGECPYCQNPMRTSIAADQQVWICDKDRHVVPLRNSEPA